MLPGRNELNKAVSNCQSLYIFLGLPNWNTVRPDYDCKKYDHISCEIIIALAMSKCKVIQIVSKWNEMPFTAWKHTERNRQRDRKRYVMISWGFLISAVQNNSLNDSTYHFLEPT